MEAGIVGLPNVGKSTLFNALTAAGALAANYPFATIEPNVGVVPIPDPFGLGWACGRALDLFRQNPARVETLRARGMSEDLSWSRSAKEYERLLDRAREKESRRVLAL